MIAVLANVIDLLLITFLTHPWYISVCQIAVCQNASITAQPRLLDHVRAAVFTARTSTRFAVSA